MLRMHRPDYDGERNPEARPESKRPEHDPNDENAYDEDAEAMEQMAHEHGVLEATGVDHQREEAEEKKK
jgi:hypothetical protein